MTIKTNEILSYVSTNSRMRFLNDKNTLLEKDLLNFASMIFNTETIFRMNLKIDKVTIPISDQTAHDIDLKKIKAETERLLRFVLMREIAIDFDIKIDAEKRKRDYDLEFEKTSTICLFSGGVDSFSGIMKSKEVYPDLAGVFVAHGDQSKGVHIVNELYSKKLKAKNIQIFTLYAPPMKRYGYSQLRGFLYCMYGSIYMSLLGAKNILITECGPTMYQSRFSPFDSVTMTTHPFVLQRTKAIIEIFLRRQINMLTPFENLTKAEVIATSPKKTSFSETHSCISLGTGRNCGHCYGCVVRRLGSIVADREDAEYDNDPITKDFKKGDNLISLLRFSHDILTNYDKMNFTSKENIYIYKKQRLFKRFALDNFAAIYILQSKGIPTNPYADNLYAAVIKYIGIEKIKQRISDVRTGRFIPSFSRKVSLN